MNLKKKKKDRALCFMMIRIIKISYLLLEKLRLVGYIEFIMSFSMLNHEWMRNLCESRPDAVS